MERWGGIRRHSRSVLGWFSHLPPRMTRSHATQEEKKFFHKSPRLEKDGPVRLPQPSPHFQVGSSAVMAGTSYSVARRLVLTLVPVRPAACSRLIGQRARLRHASGTTMEALIKPGLGWRQNKKNSMRVYWAPVRLGQSGVSALRVARGPPLV